MEEQSERNLPVSAIPDTAENDDDDDDEKDWEILKISLTTDN
jgi:hypothetical protein